MYQYLKDMLLQVALITLIITVVMCLAATIHWIFNPHSPSKTNIGRYFKGDIISKFFQEKPEAYELYFNAKNPNLLDLHIADEIYAPNEYSKLVVTLAALPPETTLKVYLNGYGGSSAGMFRLIHALNITKAKVVYTVDGDVYSAHAILACSAKKENIAPGIYMMFHSYSSGSPTKGSDAVKFHLAATKSLKDILTSRCGTTLSKDEIDNILNGVDVYKHY